VKSISLPKFPAPKEAATGKPPTDADGKALKLPAGFAILHFASPEGATLAIQKASNLPFKEHQTLYASPFDPKKIRQMKREEFLDR